MNRTYTGELEDRIKQLEAKLAIADGYLCSIALHHPHLVPNEKISDNEYRLTIYDAEQAILENK